MKKIVLQPIIISLRSMTSLNYDQYRLNFFQHCIVKDLFEDDFCNKLGYPQKNSLVLSVSCNHNQVVFVKKYTYHLHFEN